MIRLAVIAVLLGLAASPVRAETFEQLWSRRALEEPPATAPRHEAMLHPATKTEPVTHKPRHRFRPQKHYAAQPVAPRRIAARGGRA
jgi:hypothetical protein